MMNGFHKKCFQSHDWKSDKCITEKKLRTVLVGIGLLFCLAGCGISDEALVFTAGTDDVSSEENSPKETAVSTETGKMDAGTVNMVCVYVCGAVKNPGVVELPRDSRIEDALNAAGGFADNAAVNAVNLAQKVTDGEMVYFPDTEEQEVVSDDRVDINTAKKAELCTLTGIGEARAEAIIAYREEHGDFKTIEEIMKVPGIKTQAYEKIKDQIVVR